MRSTALIILILLLNSLGHAQDSKVPPVRTFETYKEKPTVVAADTPVTSIPAEPGKLTIHADPKVERLMRDYVDHKHPQKGYRVQIFLGDRKTAEESKRSFLLKHPETPAYLSWLAPNFRLRVGDLRTKLEADRLLRDLKGEYPGSYIVPDDIEMQQLPDDR